MVTLKQKQQAINYIAGLIEASGMYTITTSTDRSFLAHENESFTNFPKSYEILLANCYAPITDFTTQYSHNRQSNIWTVPIFYKDQNTSFVRLAEKQSWRTDQSLKRYTPEKINEMLHLRGIEKEVVKLFGNSLSYYQPTTDRLEESIRQFQLQPVNLDYSHLGFGDPGYGFATDRESIDYKLLTETQRITTALALTPLSKNDYHKRARVVKTDIITPEVQPLIQSSTMQDVETELRKNARQAYPNLSPEEALRVYSGGKI